jgi:hypothetical protein
MHFSALPDFIFPLHNNFCLAKFPILSIQVPLGGLMKLIAGLLLISAFANAETFIFEPYVDAHYSCNFFDGANSVMQVDAESPEHAAQLVKNLIGQNLTLTCNQDVYECVHTGAGDLEPRVVEQRSTDKEFVVIGGRILDSTNTKELLQVGDARYHRGLRPLPRCPY